MFSGEPNNPTPANRTQETDGDHGAPAGSNVIRFTAAVAAHATTALEYQSNVVLALCLASQGFYVFPVNAWGSGAKFPFAGFKWREKSSNVFTEVLAMWEDHPGAAVAIDCGKSGLLVVDADFKYKYEDGVSTGLSEWHGLVKRNGGLPANTPISETPSRGQHVIFRQKPGLPMLGNSAGDLPKGNDIRGDGGYFLAAGTWVESGQYKLIQGSLDDIPIMPDWVDEMLRYADAEEAKQIVYERLEGLPLKRERQKIAKALRMVDATDRDTRWYKALAIIKSRLDEDGRDLARAWSQTVKDKFDPVDFERVWDSFQGVGGNRGGRPMAGVGSLMEWAKEAKGKMPPQNAGLFEDIINEELPPPGPEEFGLHTAKLPATPPAVGAAKSLDFLTDEDEKTLPGGFRYATTDDGFIRHIEYEVPPKNEKEEPKWYYLCSPIKFRAVTSNIEGEGWGLHLLIRDPDNRWRSMTIAQAETVEANGLHKRLANLGLVCKARQKLLGLLILAPLKIRARACCAPHVGWQERPDGRNIFVLPDRTIGGADGEVVYQPETLVKLAYGTKGTLEGWQGDVARPAIGNSRLIFSLSMALAGPLLRPLKIEGGGFHVRGPSSTGKTTLLAAAGSVWGGGGANGFINSWRITDNAIEGRALAHTDTLLCLDELAQVAPDAAAKIAYMLANGSGKGRLTQEVTLRRVHEWLVLFLSTGEISLRRRLAGG